MRELHRNILKLLPKIVDFRYPFCYNHTCAKKRRGARCSGPALYDTVF